MPLTAAERQARRREKLRKEGSYSDYKRKNAEQKRKSRVRQKNRPSQEDQIIQQKRREQTRQRVARWRALKKQRTVILNQPTPIFKSARAVNKPSSRTKRRLNDAKLKDPREKSSI